MNELINKEFEDHIEVANSLKYLNDDITLSAQMCIDCLKKGGKILLFGNGGSAADAQHIAAELVGRYKVNRKGLPAIALSTDTSALTAIGNDFGFEEIFNRQVEALASKGDVAIGISTSGKSLNVLNALNLSLKLNLKTIALTGRDGGEMKKICDSCIEIPSEDTARIQEMHIVIGHTICHLIEKNLF